MIYNNSSCFLLFKRNISLRLTQSLIYNETNDNQPFNSDTSHKCLLLLVVFSLNASLFTSRHAWLNVVSFRVCHVCGSAFLSAWRDVLHVSTASALAFNIHTVWMEKCAIKCFTKSSLYPHLSMGPPGYTFHHDGLVLLLNLKSVVFLSWMNLQISKVRVSTVTSRDKPRTQVEGEITGRCSTNRKCEF